MLYVHIITGERLRPYVVRPYRNRLTSTYIMLYAYIVIAGRPRPDVVHIETDARPCMYVMLYIHIVPGGRPRMSCSAPIEKLMDIHLCNGVRP